MVKPQPRWLILSQYYAPEIGAPQIRLRALARNLLRLGVDVGVLTAMPNYPAGKIFPGYTGKWSMSESIDGVPVRRTWVYAATGSPSASVVKVSVPPPICFDHVSVVAIRYARFPPSITSQRFATGRS